MCQSSYLSLHRSLQFFHVQSIMLFILYLFRPILSYDVWYTHSALHFQALDITTVIVLPDEVVHHVLISGTSWSCDTLKDTLLNIPEDHILSLAITCWRLRLDRGGVARGRAHPTTGPFIKERHLVWIAVRR